MKNRYKSILHAILGSKDVKRHDEDVLHQLVEVLHGTLEPAFFGGKRGATRGILLKLVVEALDQHAHVGQAAIPHNRAVSCQPGIAFDARHLARPLLHRIEAFARRDSHKVCHDIIFSINVVFDIRFPF